MGVELDRAAGLFGGFADREEAATTTAFEGKLDEVFNTACLFVQLPLFEE